jgi:Zn2+/Cd2+-exporting ATPase
MNNPTATALCDGGLCPQDAGFRGVVAQTEQHGDRRHDAGGTCKGEENACCCGPVQGLLSDPPVEGDNAERPNTRTVYRIVNMDCPMEEALIRQKLGGMREVYGLAFNLMQRTLAVRHEASARAAITDALRALNMDARVMETAPDPGEVAFAPAIPWGKLAIAGLLAAAAEALELFDHWKPGFPGTDPTAWRILGVDVMAWLPFGLAVAAILLAGIPTYRKGWTAVRHLNLNINALMSVAVTGAMIIGQYAEAAMVMVLFNLAEAIEARSLDRARNAIRNLLRLKPEKATVLGPGGARGETDIRRVAIGARVRVRPGERVALDGVILQGRSIIDQSPITGESLPVEKTVGDTVYAGTINASGSFEFRVTAAAGSSTLDRIIHAVQEARGRRAPTQRFVDRFARYYTPAVFLAALLTVVVPPLFMGGAWTQSVYTALVLLVIGCPCALVISTPVTIVSGLAAATRHGILVKGGLFLEQGRHLDWLALDKTGTLTRGKPVQTDFVVVGDKSPSDVTSPAASLAARSDHPVSKAIAEVAARKGVKIFDVDDFTAIPGQGVSGVVEGRRWHLGNRRLVEALNRRAPGLEERIFQFEKQGKSVVALVDETGVRALFAVADTVKESSIEAVDDLKRLGIRTLMLTGDNAHTARRIAGEVGVDQFQGDLLPEDKLAAVARLEEGGTVGMVGDGINDAPALEMGRRCFVLGPLGAGPGQHRFRHGRRGNGHRHRNGGRGPDGRRPAQDPAFHPALPGHPCHPGPEHRPGAGHQGGLLHLDLHGARVHVDGRVGRCGRQLAGGGQRIAGHGQIAATNITVGAGHARENFDGAPGRAVSLLTFL